MRSRITDDILPRVRAKTFESSNFGLAALDRIATKKTFTGSMVLKYLWICGSLMPLLLYITRPCDGIIGREGGG